MFLMERGEFEKGEWLGIGFDQKLADDPNFVFYLRRKKFFDMRSAQSCAWVCIQLHNSNSVARGMYLVADGAYLAA